MSTNFNEFDILFHNFFHPSSGFLSARQAKQPHPLNIFYTDDNLHFEVACTGLSKDEVNVNIEDDILKISYKNYFVLSTDYPEYNSERTSTYNSMNSNLKRYDQMWNERRIYK